MLFQVGGQGTRPTFFEMAAAQQLPSSLRAALTYSLGVFALRRPFIHKILDYEDEFFALLMLVLETHSLRTTDASFAESLYGLRRRGVKIRLKKNNILTDSGDEIHHAGLQKRQKVLSVVFLVVLPYLKSKLQSIYNKEREATLQASLWGDVDERFDNTDYDAGGNISFGSRDHSNNEASARARWIKRLQKTVGACYPWLHAGNEGLSFAYQLLYLLDATGFYSLGLHVLGIHVCRATGQELMDTSSRISKIRSRERERLRGPPWLKALQGGLLSCAYAMLDYAQTGLIAAVFFFKMMEWWYQSAEERMSAPTVYPPPPPPPPPKVAKDGIPLPPDRTLCPLCLQKRTNPSVMAVSGYVFCYTCIFKYANQYKRCPITLMPASVEQIRRLFHDV
ncbi:putative E3 ubiquitin ligase involved in peroxisome organization [Handroanthus impetiginosus]|uniref:Peroxisome biogenesis protein 12 n=1 Tax=Handroanthus impetiginosus TaxID=429701 RepID=A0A2G9HW74_9LAMI|nr:putative E3 ubiquitin ligase involved in peroxisome organization [Handroanthus impetiginosus]